MSANDSFIGHIDLLMLPSARMQTIGNEECIVIPKAANPAIFHMMTKADRRASHGISSRKVRKSSLPESSTLTHGPIRTESSIRI